MNVSDSGLQSSALSAKCQSDVPQGIENISSYVHLGEEVKHIGYFIFDVL